MEWTIYISTYLPDNQTDLSWVRVEFELFNQPEDGLTDRILEEAMNTIPDPEIKLAPCMATIVRIWQLQRSSQLEMWRECDLGKRGDSLQRPLTRSALCQKGQKMQGLKDSWNAR